MAPFRCMLLTLQSGLERLTPRTHRVPVYPAVFPHSSMPFSRRTERTLEAVGCRRWFGGVAEGTGGGSAHHTLLEDKVLARGHRLQQRRQFVQRRHGGPPLVPGIGIAGLGAQPRGGFG
jgi:hypothetical protein